MQSCLLNEASQAFASSLQVTWLQVERLQGIINKLTAENVEYRDNNKTQQFEVQIQELQREVQQTGDCFTVAEWLVLGNRMQVHSNHLQFAAATLLYASLMPGTQLSSWRNRGRSSTAAVLCSKECQALRSVRH